MMNAKIVLASIAILLFSRGLQSQEITVKGVSFSVKGSGVIKTQGLEVKNNGIVGGSGILYLTGNWRNNSGSTGFETTATNEVVFAGGNAQQISGADVTQYPKLTINKSNNDVALQITTEVKTNLMLVSGKIISTTVNLLVIKDNAIVTGGSNASFVNGPVKKFGNTAFTFPTGKGSNYQPVSMGVPSLTGDNVFTAEYFWEGQTLGAATDGTVFSLSTCEHWKLDRNSGNSRVTVTLGWNANSCLPITPASRIIAYWDGAKWINKGNGGFTGTETIGTVTSASEINMFGYFVLAKAANMIVNTVGLDSIFPPDTLRYTISGAELSGTFDVGTEVAFDATLPPAGVTPVYLNFTVSNSDNSLRVAYDISNTGVISNPRALLPTNEPGVFSVVPLLVTTHFVITNNNHIRFTSQLIFDFFVIRNLQYAELRKTLDGGYYLAKNGVLRFVYNEEYRPGNLKFNVYSSLRQVVYSDANAGLQKVNGDNRYTLNMYCPLENGFYVMEAISEKNEVFMLRFKVEKPVGTECTGTITINL